MKEAEIIQAIRLTPQCVDPLEQLPKEEYEKLKNSIKKIGQQEPVTMYANILIDGYHRYMIIKELELPLIGVQRMDFKSVPDAVQWKLNNHKNRIKLLKTTANGTFQN